MLFFYLLQHIMLTAVATMEHLTLETTVGGIAVVIISQL